MNKLRRIFLDHQATCPVDERVFKVMSECLRGEAANPHSSEHSFGWEASRLVFEAQERVAALIGADADEIIFTSGATEANNLALFGRRYKKQRRVIISGIEHKCVLEAAKRLQAERGVELLTVKVDDKGLVCLNHLEKLLNGGTSVVSIIGVHNEIGTIQPLTDISKLVRSKGSSLHLDLAQGPNAIDLAGLSELAETISLSAHKMYGPVGIGCLFVSREIQSKMRPQIVGGGQQNGLRSGTVPLALASGMAEASEIARRSPHERQHLRTLIKQLWNGLNDLPTNVELNGPEIADRHPGNLNVSFVGFDGRDLIAALQPNIAISSGSACTSGVEEPSYTIRAIGHSHERASSALRFGVGRGTTEADIALTLDLMAKAIERLRVAA